jgi:hypothetical protein
MLPQAREESLAVEELSEETLVYDLERDRVHCLNRTTSLVWRQCDGHTTVSEMAARVGRALNVPADESLVWLALERLESAHLLDGGARRPADIPRYTRREVAQRLGMAGSLSVLLPLLTSITAPTPAHAQSAGGTQTSEAPRTESPSNSQVSEETTAQSPGNSQGVEGTAAQSPVSSQVSEGTTTTSPGNSQAAQGVTNTPSPGSSPAAQGPVAQSPAASQVSPAPTQLPANGNGSESSGNGGNGGNGPSNGKTAGLNSHRRPNLGLWRIGGSDS